MEFPNNANHPQRGHNNNSVNNQSISLLQTTDQNHNLEGILEKCSNLNINKGVIFNKETQSVGDSIPTQNCSVANSFLSAKGTKENFTAGNESTSTNSCIPSNTGNVFQNSKNVANTEALLDSNANNTPDHNLDFDNLSVNTKLNQTFAITTDKESTQNFVNKTETQMPSGKSEKSEHGSEPTNSLQNLQLDNTSETTEESTTSLTEKITNEFTGKLDEICSPQLDLILDKTVVENKRGAIKNVNTTYNVVSQNSVDFVTNISWNSELTDKTENNGASARTYFNCSTQGSSIIENPNIINHDESAVNVDELIIANFDNITACHNQTIDNFQVVPETLLTTLEPTVNVELTANHIIVNSENGLKDLPNASELNIDVKLKTLKANDTAVNSEITSKNLSSISKTNVDVELQYETLVLETTNNANGSESSPKNISEQNVDVQLETLKANDATVNSEISSEKLSSISKTNVDVELQHETFIPETNDTTNSSENSPKNTLEQNVVVELKTLKANNNANCSESSPKNISEQNVDVELETLKANDTAVNSEISSKNLSSNSKTNVDVELQHETLVPETNDTVNSSESSSKNNSEQNVDVELKTLKTNDTTVYSEISTEKLSSISKTNVDVELQHETFVPETNDTVNSSESSPKNTSEQNVDVELKALKTNDTTVNSEISSEKLSSISKTNVDVELQHDTFIPETNDMTNSSENSPKNTPEQNVDVELKTLKTNDTAVNSEISSKKLSSISKTNVDVELQHETFVPETNDTVNSSESSSKNTSEQNVDVELTTLKANDTAVSTEISSKNLSNIFKPNVDVELQHETLDSEINDTTNSSESFQKNASEQNDDVELKTLKANDTLITSQSSVKNTSGKNVDESLVTKSNDVTSSGASAPKNLLNTFKSILQSNFDAATLESNDNIKISGKSSETMTEPTAECKEVTLISDIASILNSTPNDKVESSDAFKIMSKTVESECSFVLPLTEDSSVMLDPTLLKTKTAKEKRINLIQNQGANIEVIGGKKEEVAPSAGKTLNDIEENCQEIKDIEPELKFNTSPSVTSTQSIATKTVVAEVERPFVTNLGNIENRYIFNQLAKDSNSKYIKQKVYSTKKVCDEEPDFHNMAFICEKNDKNWVISNLNHNIEISHSHNTAFREENSPEKEESKVHKIFKAFNFFGIGQSHKPEKSNNLPENDNTLTSESEVDGAKSEASDVDNVTISNHENEFTTGVRNPEDSASCSKTIDEKSAAAEYDTIFNLTDSHGETVIENRREGTAGEGSSNKTSSRVNDFQSPTVMKPYERNYNSTKVKVTDLQEDANFHHSKISMESQLNRENEKLQQTVLKLQAQLLQKDEIIANQELRLKKINAVLLKYEEAMPEFTSKHKKLQSLYNTVCAQLSTLETVFHDGLEKYERAKKVLEGYKNNEVSYKTNINMLETKLVDQHKKYEEIKKQLMEQLESVNADYETLKKNEAAGVLKRNAVIRRLEIKVASLESSLSQKNKELEQLSSLYDQVMENM